MKGVSNMENEAPTQPVQPTQPIPSEQTVQTVQPEIASKSNMKYVFAGIIVLIIFVLGIVIWYSSTTSTSDTQIKPSSKTEETPAPGSLEAQINAIDIEDLDKDFADVDRDLESL